MVVPSLVHFVAWQTSIYEQELRKRKEQQLCSSAQPERRETRQNSVLPSNPRSNPFQIRNGSTLIQLYGTVSNAWSVQTSFLSWCVTTIHENRMRWRVGNIVAGDVNRNVPSQNQSSHGNNMGNTGIVQSSTMRAAWGSISSLITVPRSQEGVLIWMEEVLHQ